MAGALTSTPQELRSPASPIGVPRPVRWHRAAHAKWGQTQAARRRSRERELSVRRLESRLTEQTITGRRSDR